MNLFDNFIELEAHENLLNLDLNFFKNKKLTIEVFEQEIDLDSEDTENVKNLDFFIEKFLKIYPQIYPNISLKKTKNRLRKNENQNNFFEQLFEDALARKDINKAVSLTNMKSFMPRNKSIFSIKDKELENAVDILLNSLSNEILRKEVEETIKTKLEKNFKIILTEKECIYLSKLMSWEIYLRTVLPIEYVFSDAYINSEHSYKNFEIECDKIIYKEIVKKIKEGNRPKEISTFLELHYFR